MDGTVPDAPRGYPEATTGLSRYTIEHGDLMREYLVYVPEGYTHNTATPALLNFHGFSDAAERYIRAADLRAVADAEGVILVYPQGSPLNIGESHWNPLLESENNKSDVDDFGFVSAMLDALSERLNVDTARVYATGYSNGAGITYGLACYLSDRIAAIAPVSGSMYTEMPANCNSTHPTAVAIFNGTQDGERPFDGYPGFLMPVDDAAAFWAGQNNIDDPAVSERFETNGLTVERNRYSGGTAGAVVDRYKVIGGGHVWFDLEIEGADLNQLIWNFVSRYDLNGLR
jgi:poly(3-hydroxybutyrate) depolymerase